jgi:signal transduction histidine kinase/ActR/RegA family two-component response regulator
MRDEEALRLLSALAVPADRPAVAARLAREAGAAALYVLVRHPDVADKLLPAPGFQRTLPSSRGWRDLSARCLAPGVHTADVAHPTAAETTSAVAYAFDGIAFVFAGGGPPDEALSRALALGAPLLAGLLGAEAEVVSVRGDLEVARQAAVRSATLARALDAARGEAERATRVKDEFLAMLGHELRNPLAPIVTALQMMRLEGSVGRTQEILERQVAHLMRLVDDLLDVSRITQGKVELRRERIELSAVVARAVEMTRPLLEGKRNDLVLEVPDRGLVVDGDPARLAQVLSNLLTNASKYSDPGTRVRVVAERAGDRARITVEDEGIGIAPAFIERVFEQFVQVPQGLARSGGGLGLGLAIVRSLVQQHGGHVSVFSEGIGKGSRFVVELPLAAPAAVPVPEPPAAAEPPPDGADARVLVVDDNDDAAALLGAFLRRAGCAVRTAPSGTAALALVEAFTPDAAVLDIGLPVMDGYELARRLRARLPGIRLVALTGYGRPDDRERTRDAGFDAHLVKPVDAATLQAALEPVRRGAATGGGVGASSLAGPEPPRVP